MCRHYSHTYRCHHTETIFADYCRSAALRQTPCAGGEIWASFCVNALCAPCEAIAAALRLSQCNDKVKSQTPSLRPGAGAEEMARLVEEKYGKGRNMSKGKLWTKGWR